MKKAFAAAARNIVLETWQEKMLGIIGKRVTTGSRPYPYVYTTSRGKVTRVEFHPSSRQCTFYTDMGEVIRSQDYDLTHDVEEVRKEK